MRHPDFLLCSYLLVVLAEVVQSEPKKPNAKKEETKEVDPFEKFYDGRTYNLPLSYTATHDLYEHWLHKAVSGIIAAVAEQKLPNAPEISRRNLEKCSKHSKHPIQHARCVVPLLLQTQDHQHSFATNPNNVRLKPSSTQISRTNTVRYVRKKVKKINNAPLKPVSFVTAGPPARRRNFRHRNRLSFPRRKQRKFPSDLPAIQTSKKLPIKYVKVRRPVSRTASNRDNLRRLKIPVQWKAHPSRQQLGFTQRRTVQTLPKISRNLENSQMRKWTVRKRVKVPVRKTQLRRYEQQHHTDYRPLHVRSQTHFQLMNPNHVRFHTRPVYPVQTTYGGFTQPVTNTTTGRANWIGGFRLGENARIRRTKREIRILRRNKFRLKTPAEVHGPLGKVADFLTNTVRFVKNSKRKTVGWRQTMKRLQRLGKINERRHSVSKQFISRLDHPWARKAPTHHRFNSRYTNSQRHGRPLSARNLLHRLESEYGNNQRSNRRRRPIIYQHPVSRPRQQPPIWNGPVGIIRDGVKLGMAMTGHNVSNFSNRTLKLISPRFFSLFPDKSVDGTHDDSIKLLSPSLFNFHDQGSSIERRLSMPRLIKSFAGRDVRNKWMDLIFEAAGIADIADKYEERVLKKPFFSSRRKHEKITGPDGQPLYFTRKNATEILGPAEDRKFQVFDCLYSSLSKRQTSAMNSSGYAFLDYNQLKIIYGRSSPYKARLNFDIRKYANMTDEQRQTMLEDSVKLLAAMRSFDVRLKDLINQPQVNAPIILMPQAISNMVILLSPLILSPAILSPSVLGPIILSPWVFTPLILSPRVLGPIIVNPIVGSPAILSPLVLNPLILVPGVLNPFILSPLVLSPFILSPQVMSPLILNPFVLSPIILSPGVMNPIILSPFLLSPVIYSPQAIFALVLSPNALSPLIESPTFIATVVASPDILAGG